MNPSVKAYFIFLFLLLFFSPHVSKPIHGQENIKMCLDFSEEGNSEEFKLGEDLILYFVKPVMYYSSNKIRMIHIQNHSYLITFYPSFPVPPPECV